jgi:hypothetical protein
VQVKKPSLSKSPAIFKQHKQDITQRNTLARPASGFCFQRKQQKQRENNEQQNKNHDLYT